MKIEEHKPANDKKYPIIIPPYNPKGNITIKELMKLHGYTKHNMMIVFYIIQVVCSLIFLFLWLKK